MTHAIIQPTVDKGAPDVYAGDGEVCVHKVGRTAGGIVVRGARALATLAPFADEMFVYAGQPLPADAERFALVFSVPMSTPGLKVLCRDSYSSPLRDDPWADHFDHPFSRQFDEQDAMVIFDDVVVPDERVFLDGDLQLHNTSLQSTWTANVLQQTSIRAAVKLQLCWELAARMAEVVHDESATTQQLLGELWTYAELTRAAVAAAEAGAQRRRRWGVVLRRATVLGAAADVAPLVPPGLRDHQAHRGPQPARHPDGPPARPRRAPPPHRPVLPGCRRPRGRGADPGVPGGLGPGRLRARGEGELYERFYLASAARTSQMAHAVAARRLRAEPATLLDEFLGSSPWQAGTDGPDLPR